MSLAEILTEQFQIYIFLGSIVSFVMQFLDRVYDLRFLPKFQYRPILAEIGLPCFIVMNPLILARSALLSWSCITSIYSGAKKNHISVYRGEEDCVAQLLHMVQHILVYHQRLRDEIFVYFLFYF